MTFNRCARRVAGIGLATVFALGAFDLALAGESHQIDGAGSSFAYPLYSAWAQPYAKQTDVKLNYQSVGSGAGQRQLAAGTVDFGASDAPWTPDVQMKEHIMQWPTAVGGVIPTIHLPGVKPGELVLSGPVLADIFMGKIAYWDDAAITGLNKGLKLPHKKIVTVHRSDGSGTTWIFTNYLSKVSPAWKEKLGFDKAVAWPGGVGGKGNEGVAAYVGRLDYSIGYNEYAYVLQNHMNYARMVNKAGKVVAPTAESFAAAAGNADWKGADRFDVVITDQPGEATWPISGATFVAVHVQPGEHAGRIRDVLKFFDWGFKQGGEAANRLDYVPMPKSVIEFIETEWHKQIKDAKGQALWPAS
ncbi:phosphate ABC transporter substrate-binding protein PstS [Nitrogeniibacter mangrovi]|uniref:Phosphate-binding protein PstS n=1 Tax=Nitrogeniibacter mangrovi TaxID=2016596 RepID=A0A6C1B4P9_9RHOO|nr:phosphate ABC transporter substrate-binding protein PstS [Nitrogeniibacter mangrovi]QID18662.1 phosphate ABC transporter substrate-binding protein PstS [Nitrogeniibacter mangrovi]